MMLLEDGNGIIDGMVTGIGAFLFATSALLLILFVLVNEPSSSPLLLLLSHHHRRRCHSAPCRRRCFFPLPSCHRCTASMLRRRHVAAHSAQQCWPDVKAAKSTTARLSTFQREFPLE